MATAVAEPASILVKRDGNYPCVSVTVRSMDVHVVAFGCLHVGSDNFCEELLDRTIKWVKDNNALWIGTGDWMENATKFSPGDGVYKQTMSPDEQMDYLMNKFRPISDLCIGCIRGNHEETYDKDHGHRPYGRHMQGT